MSIVRKYVDAELPDGWRVVRLADVATLQRGIDLPEADRVAGQVPVYGSNGLLGYHDSSPIGGPGVITGRSGSIGFVYYCVTAFWPLNTTLYVKDFHGNNKRYAYHLLSNLHLERFSASTGVPSLNRNFVHPYLVTVPPLSEQRAIADMLDSIDEAIEHTGDVIAATETLRDALLHELLARGVPGWHTEWKDVPGIGTIPASWEVVRLGDGVVHVGSGVTPRGGKSAYTASGITFLRSQNVHFDGLRLEAVVYIPPEIDHAMTRSRVRPDDVLLNITGASIGRCTVVPSDFGPANVNQHVCIVRTSEELNPHFVWKWLSTPRSQTEIDDIQTGQSRQGLNYQQVRQLTIARPPSAEQDAIVGILSRVDLTIAETKRERDGLRLLKDSTADALLTGRVQTCVRVNANAGIRYEDRG